MFIKRFISAILAVGMCVQSCCVYALPTYKVAETDSAPIVPAPIVSDIILEDKNSSELVVEDEVKNSSELVVEDEVKMVEETSIVNEVASVASEEPIIEEVVFGLTESEIDLIALITMAEAEGESELGKRAVIDVILNRYDSTRFPNTINGVIYAENAFECLQNDRVNRCYVREDIRQLVLEELENRTYSNIHYFRASYYHGFGTPVINIGNHYFSTY